MPPGLAAFLLIVLGCDMRVVQAIDLGMEWRITWSDSQENTRVVADDWYRGWLGIRRRPSSKIGTFVWPRVGPEHRKYK
jgi:hypothetical protein